MIQCSNCGQFNNGGSAFCRFCGTRMLQSEMEPQSYEYNPPRPYSWKTDEFKTSDPIKVSRINQVQPLMNRNVPAQRLNQPPLMNNASLAGNFHQPMMNYGYRCPNCGTQNFPRLERRISTAGWIVFAVLLVMFFPLFWIGLLLKEDVKVCSVCNLKIG